MAEGLLLGPPAAEVGLLPLKLPARGQAFRAQPALVQRLRDDAAWLILVAVPVEPVPPSSPLMAILDRKETSASEVLPLRLLSVVPGDPGGIAAG